MTFARNRFSLGFAFLVLLAAPLSAVAGEAVGHMVATPSTIEWQTAASHDAVVLTISGPNDFTYTKSFSGNAFIRLQDLGGQAGTYSYDLRLIPRISSDVKHQLAVAREANDDAAIKRIQAAAGLNDLPYQSGAFTILNGAFVSPDLTEGPQKNAPKAATASVGSGTASGSRVVPPAKAMDVVTADDAIIQGSLCVGLDCVNNESFGFDTIRLKENNTRIHFDDDSTSPGFPNVRWQLTANDSASGGANKFSIDDLTNSKTPFTVTAAAPTNSLFVASTGKVGFGNNNPILNLHITATDTPAIRQEQTSGGGFTAQTWDIGANEANWFVRDVTGGSRLPLRIRPGAPTSSIDIQANGNVGIGTASAQRALDVQANFTGATARMQNFNASGFAGTEYLDPSGTVKLFIGLDNGNNAARVNTLNGNPFLVMFDSVEKFRFTATGLGIGGVTPSNPIQHTSGAILTAGGVWQNASSRALKEDIRDLDADAAMAAFRKLEPVTYNYKVDPKEHHVGFIAEDVPDLVAAKDHKSLSPLDIVALLTKVVQQQQQTIDELSAKVSAMEKKQ